MTDDSSTSSGPTMAALSVEQKVRGRSSHGTSAELWLKRSFPALRRSVPACRKMQCGGSTGAASFWIPVALSDLAVAPNSTLKLVRPGFGLGLKPLGHLLMM